MQAYGAGFARVYNRRWIGFARQVAPLLLDFYAATPLGQENKQVLDLCCGTGQVALHFLSRGYQVTGLDLSEHMLQYAQENARIFMEIGHARFVQADVTNFTLDERFGLAISTFDALNHLDNEAALRACFHCVATVCDGIFIFDLNTRLGLRRWNSIEVDDSNDDMLIVNHGIYAVEAERSWMRVVGFVRQPEGLYERFEETVYNTVFDLARVEALLYETGWKDVYFAHLRDLKTPLDEPEKEGRVFIVAQK